MLVTVLAGCGRQASTTSDTDRRVNFQPNTHIDSLYLRYLNSDGQKRVSNANNLLAAICEEEQADSLLQFTTGESPDVIDAQVSYWMSEYFCYSSRYNEAESVSLLALEKAPKVKEPGFEIEIYSLLGLICQRMGKNEDALRYMQKCYEASSRSGNLEDQSSDLSNLAAISLALRNAELAKQYIDKAIEIERRLGRDNLLAIRYGIASEAYQQLGLLDQAEEFASEAYNLDIKAGREGKAAIRLSQLAAVLMAKGENARATEILLQAVPALKADGNNYSLAVVENQLGSLYLERGMDAEASRHFKAALEACADGGNLYFRQRALTGLAKSLKDSNLKQAYGYLAESAVVADSIYQLNNKKELAEIEQKYHESEALRESEHRAYERKVQIYALMIILTMAVLLISVLFFIIRNKNRRQLILRSLEKMRSNFFTNVTHEFRTPITVIMGLSGDIARDEDSSSQSRVAAEAISAQSHGLLDLVNQLLDISKVQSEIGTPDWRRGNVVNYMHMIAEKYMPTASHKGIDLVFSPSENTIIMDFIPAYLHKILHNLISNALKFTPKGGRIYISTSVREGMLVLRVADTGIGIDRADLAHVFEPYYQGENSGMGIGTGIGLSLVDRMVRAMDGTVTVKSLPHKGSVFTITLPMSHAGKDVKELDDTERHDTEGLPTDLLLNSTPAVHAEADAENSGDDRPIVLIVEDHAEVASYIGSHLAGYQVQYARNGREGLAKALELIPDVIVTDLMMPEMDGLEMTGEIRKDASVSHIPVIVITARADEHDKILALKAGADAYLIKPFNGDELEVRVSQLISQRRMLCEKYQLALAMGNIDSTDLPEAADRDFLNNIVGVVYSLIQKSEPTDLKVVASRMGLSPRSLSRKIQALTGDTPLLYINKIKIGKAKALIDANPAMTLADIAYRCGFDSPNYFSRIFKQIEGLNPTAYRRRVK